MTGTSDNGLSIILSGLFDSYGLDEDNRRRRIRCQKMCQLLHSWYYESKFRGQISILLSGSAYETTTIQGLSSDIDLMEIQNNIYVIDNIQQWRNDRVNAYMMDRTGCYPGFVKLHLLSTLYPGPAYRDALSHTPQGHVVDEDGKILLRNDYYSKMASKKRPTAEVHGPAYTTPRGRHLLETDHVLTFICKSFPGEAIWWKSRQTQLTRDRIGGNTIDSATYCYLVGVGNKRSPTENIEWRISFSHIENLLVHSWNNVVYKCYVMMKFINKGLIKPLLPDVLCSYHFKTTLMWMVEEYTKGFFNESNFNGCLIMILNHLTSAVRRRSLPHYFVEGHNLFYRLEGKSTQAMVVILERIVANWPYSLFNIKIRKLGPNLHACLSSQIAIKSIRENIYHERRENANEFELPQELTGVLASYQSIKLDICRKVQPKLHKIFELKLRAQDDLESRNFIDIVIKDILCNFGLHLIRCSKTMPNKMALNYKKTGIGCIERFVGDGCLNTALEVAGEYTLMRRYERVLELLEVCERQVKYYTSFSCCHSDACNQFCSRSYLRALFDNKPTMKEFCKNYRALIVTYSQEDLPLVPRALAYEMYRTTAISPPVSNIHLIDWYNKAVVHCNVYLYFLQFLCFHALGRLAQRQVALDNMVWASNELGPIGSHLETNHNLLGVCYRTVGQLQRSYREYRKSLVKQKHHNAAIWHLAVLMRGKVRSGRR